MASSTIPLTKHRIIGTRDEGNKSGSFTFPDVRTRTVIVIGWSEIYVLYIEYSTLRTFSNNLSAQISRNMVFTCHAGDPTITWTSDYQVYADPIILY